MTNNDVLRRIRYILDYSDKKMTEFCLLADFEVSLEQMSKWLKKDDEADYENCTDSDLAKFLNGFIIEKRGKKDGPQPKAEKTLTNNIIFNKLKIAFNLKAEDIIEVLGLADFSMSKHELSAFFRRPEHSNYRQCKDQVLRNFMSGLQLKYRKNSEKGN